MKDQRGPLPEIIQRLRQFVREQDQYVMIATHDFEDEIIEMNVERQLNERGILSTGSPITPEYKSITEMLKRNSGKEWRHVTLRDNGDFHNSVFVRFEEKRFVLDATDPKKGALERKYGRKILGITDENLQILIDQHFRPRAQDIFRKAIFG